MRAALYARVSTTDKGQDVENQLIQMREFAKHQGWTITREYLDHETGSKADREQFSEMFKGAARRAFDVLIFWSLDRLTREGTLETLLYLQRLTNYGIAWKSLSEQFLDTCGPFKDAIVGFLAALAKQERIRLSERTKAGLARVKASGTKLGRPRANPDISYIVRQREQGASWRAIGRDLGLSAKVCKEAAQSAYKTSAGTGS